MSLLSARDLWVAPPADGPRTQDAPDAVVRGFSLEVDAGEWVTLSGANGCGKTSLLLALSGLWPARSGTVRFEGRAFGPHAPREARSRVAVILQDPSCQLLQPTVREELAFSALNVGRPEAEVARQVERWAGCLGLVPELDRDPQHLSAGRQQLVLLAAALIAQPVLLLADEPAAHLDAEARRLALEVVRGAVDRGLAVVWVTQDAGERAAADCALDLGGAEPPDSGHLHDGPATPSDLLLTLRVAPWDGAVGPSVRTSRPLEVPIARRGVTAVEGPNGAGKSVLLAAAAGLLRLDQVQVARESAGGPPAILATQYPELEVFEERVGDEVAYAAVSRGIPRAEAIGKAAMLFDRLGLPAGRFLQRRTWSLSGGEKRLVSVVGALLAPTSLLVLDEPTAGLDGGRRAGLAKLVNEAAMRTAVLVASQDRAWLEWLAGRRFRLAGADRPLTPSLSKKTD